MVNQSPGFATSSATWLRWARLADQVSAAAPRSLSSRARAYRRTCKSRATTSRIIGEDDCRGVSEVSFRHALDEIERECPSPRGFNPSAITSVCFSRASSHPSCRVYMEAERSYVQVIYLEVRKIYQPGYSGDRGERQKIYLVLECELSSVAGILCVTVRPERTPRKISF